MNNELFYIVGIDPGSNVGVSIYGIDGYTLNIVTIETFVIPLENYIAPYATDKLTSKLGYLSNIMLDICVRYNPLVLAVEEAFLNMKFPLAVMQLSQYLGIILNTFVGYNPTIKVFKYAPRYVKRLFNAGGNADKDDMTKALLTVDEITSKYNVLGLCEHEVDALAIGYVTLSECRRYPLVLYALV